MTTSSTSQSMTLTERINEKLKHPMIDYQVLFGATIILLGGGLVFVVSASSVFAYTTMDNSFALSGRQAAYGAIGLLGMIKVSRMHPTKIRRWAPILMFIVLFALVLVLAIGTAVHGQRNWIQIVGPVRLQPSEFAKLAVVLWGADVFARKRNLIHIRSQLLSPVGIVFAAILALILAEGDLGTAMVMTPIMMSLFYFIGAPMKWLWGVVSAGLLGIALLTYLAPYRMARFTSWLHPGADPEGAGYQVTHGKLALGSGGFWGVGLGGSKEKWGTLPEAHTDFIYAVVGEESGILGTFAILFLFAVIIFVGIRVSSFNTDPFVKLASLGIVAWIATQMSVNIGAVLGLLPVTGVPLPLVSYGGSSLIPTLLGLGMLMSFARPEHRTSTES